MPPLTRGDMARNSGKNGGLMNKLINILLITCIFGLINCADSNKLLLKPDLPASAIERRNLMIGKWLGEMKDEKGNLQQWLIT